MIISLTGFMGCGKTSVGKKLSELMQREFLDLDSYIATRERCSVPEIFASKGETEFRRIEQECLSSILQEKDGIILSLGGGTVMTPGCFKLIHEKTCCYYLKAEARTIREHLLAGRSLEEAAAKRPLLKGNGIEELLLKRSPVYEEVADYVVEADGRSVLELAHEIYLHNFAFKQ